MPVDTGTSGVGDRDGDAHGSRVRGDPPRDLDTSRDRRVASWKVPGTPPAAGTHRRWKGVLKPVLASVEKANVGDCLEGWKLLVTHY